MMTSQDVIDRLPLAEAKILRAHESGVAQVEIARRYRVTPSAISQKLSRIRLRIAFLQRLPAFAYNDMRRDLCAVFDPADVRALWLFYRSGSQSHVSRVLDVPKSVVRWNLLRMMEQMREATLQFAISTEYLRAFELILANPFALQVVGVD